MTAVLPSGSLACVRAASRKEIKGILLIRNFSHLLSSLSTSEGYCLSTAGKNFWQNEGSMYTQTEDHASFSDGDRKFPASVGTAMLLPCSCCHLGSVHTVASNSEMTGYCISMVQWSAHRGRHKVYNPFSSPGVSHTFLASWVDNTW